MPSSWGKGDEQTVSQSGNGKRERGLDTGQICRRREELEDLPKDQLVDMMLQMEGEWSESTLRMKKPSVIRSFSLDLPWEAHQTLRLGTSVGNGQPIWRILLVSFDISHPILGLEVCGEVTVGRESDDPNSHLNLAAFSAASFGVSRQHALLRPTPKKLLLADLGSTNGTRRNGVMLQPGRPEELEDKDIVVFGALQFQIRVAERPG